MGDERLKNDGSILTTKYFEEQLQRIREIRLSERKSFFTRQRMAGRASNAGLKTRRFG